MKKLYMFLILISLAVNAGITPTMKVEGTVGDFDEKNVKLHHNGKVSIVPRASIPKYFKIKPGNKVFAVIDSKDIKKKLKEKK
jgi:hypothetical protein